MYTIFDHIYSACFVVQQKIYGRFAREIWGHQVLRSTLAILAFVMMALLNRYKANLFVMLCPILICFGILIHYNTKNRTNDLERLLDNFRKLSKISQSFFIGYILLLFVVLPILIFLLILLNILGYL